MKKLTKLLLLVILLGYVSCNNETLNENTTLAEEEALMEDEILVSDGEEDETFILTEDSEVMGSDLLTVSMFSNSTKENMPKILRTCMVIDADRSPFNIGGSKPSSQQQPAANFWWSLNGGTDYFKSSTYFSTKDDNKLTFTEYDNLTAHISGTTVNEKGCVVEVDVWLKEKKSWDDWSSTAINGIFGNHKKEGTAGNASDSSLMDFYFIDSERSTLTATGDCGGPQGKYGVEQRPDPFTDGMNFGAHMGPGGANYDSNKEAMGLSTWGHIFDLETKERKWVMDFNFLLDCTDITEECKPCTGKVEDLKLKFDWCRSKHVKIYQKRENSCYGVKVFDAVLNPKEEFSIYGANSDGTFGTYVYIYINNCYYTKIKTNCYLKIGPGYTRGVFDVIGGNSTEGGELCEYVKPDYKCYRHWICKFYSRCKYGY